MDNLIKNYIQGHAQALKRLDGSIEAIKEIASLCIHCLNIKGKIIFMGNGGSAADAQHLAAELVGRFKKNRNPLAGLALSTNTSIITAIANDFGFDEIFSRQIEGLASKNDLIIGISTSGNSKNIIKGVLKAKDMGLKTIGLLGKDGGGLKSLVDTSITIPEIDTPHVQEMHILVGHLICDIIECSFSDQK
jgi:D-sedoheptulose 7-phosphate isomerase